MNWKLAGLSLFVLASVLVAQQAADSRISSRQVSVRAGRVLAGDSLTRAAEDIHAYNTSVPSGGVSRAQAVQTIQAVSATIVSNQTDAMFEEAGLGLRFSVTGFYDMAVGGTVSVENAVVRNFTNAAATLSTDILNVDVLRGGAAVHASNLTAYVDGELADLAASNLTVLAGLDADTLRGETLQAGALSADRIIGVSSQEQVRLVKIGEFTEVYSTMSSNLVRDIVANTQFRDIIRTNYTVTDFGSVTNYTTVVSTNDFTEVETNWVANFYVYPFQAEVTNCVDVAHPYTNIVVTTNETVVTTNTVYGTNYVEVCTVSTNDFLGTNFVFGATNEYNYTESNPVGGTNYVLCGMIETNQLGWVETNVYPQITGIVTPVVATNRESASRHLGYVWTNQVTLYYPPGTLKTNMEGRVYIDEPAGTQPPGDGSSTSPWLISDIRHLAWCKEQSHYPSRRYYKQTADIDATETYLWNFMGSNHVEGFEGIPAAYRQVSAPDREWGNDKANSYVTYDGQGHSIMGLWKSVRGRAPVVFSTKSRYGLFMNAGESTIRNLVLGGYLKVRRTDRSTERDDDVLVGGVAGVYFSPGIWTGIVSCVDIDVSHTVPVRFNFGGLVAWARRYPAPGLRVYDVTCGGSYVLGITSIILNCVGELFGSLFEYTTPRYGFEVKRALILSQMEIRDEGYVEGGIYGGIGDPTSSYDINYRAIGNYGIRRYFQSFSKPNDNRPYAVFGLNFDMSTYSRKTHIPLYDGFVVGFDEFHAYGASRLAFSAKPRSQMYTNNTGAVVGDNVLLAADEVVPRSSGEHLVDLGNGSVVYASRDRMTKSYTYAPVNLAGGGGKPVDPEWPYESLDQSQWTKSGQLCGWYPVPKVNNPSLTVISTVTTNELDYPTVYEDIGGGLYVGRQTNEYTVATREMQTFAMSNHYAVGATLLTSTSVVLDVHHELYLRHEDLQVSDTLYTVTVTTNFMNTYASSLHVYNPWVVLGDISVTGSIYVMQGGIAQYLGADRNRMKTEYGLIRVPGTVSTNRLSGITYASLLQPVYMSRYASADSLDLRVAIEQPSMAFDWWPDNPGAENKFAVWAPRDSGGYTKLAGTVFPVLTNRTFRFSSGGEPGHIVLKSAPSDTLLEYAGEAVFDGLDDSQAGIMFSAGGAYRDLRVPAGTYTVPGGIVSNLQILADQSVRVWFRDSWYGGALDTNVAVRVDVVSASGERLSDKMFREAVQIVSYDNNDIAYTGRVTGFTRFSPQWGRTTITVPVVLPALDLQAWGPYDATIRVTIDEASD